MNLKPDHLLTIKHIALAGARAIRANGEECADMLLLFNATPSGKLGSVEGILIAPLSKDQQAAMHRKQANDPSIAAAVMIQEAWIAVLAPGQPIPPGRVRDNPNREECLLVNVMTATEQYLLTATIDGKHIDDAEFVKVTPENFKGRFIREPAA